MPAPSVTVNVTTALPRRGAPSSTGTAFFATSVGTTGPTTPIRLTSLAAAEAAFGVGPFATWVGDTLAEGTPEVVAVRAVSGRTVNDGVTTNASTTVTSATAAFTSSDISRTISGAGIPSGATITAVGSATSITISAAATASATGVTLTLGPLSTLTAAEWETALSKFTVSEFGMGQVAIPGVSTAAAHDAVVAHSAATGRTWLADGADNPTASALTTLATNQAAKSAAKYGAVFGPWVPYDATNRLVPGSVLAAGLAARGDARVGHTNHAPAGTHSGGAGLLRRANAVATSFTSAELNTLSDAGVNVFLNTPQGPALFDWKSVSTDPQFDQLNHGRMVMKLHSEMGGVVRGFLFRQITPALYAEVEGALRGYLMPLYDAGALFGDEADESFDVQVAEVNTTTDAAEGRLNAAVAVRFSSHTDTIVINVNTHLADGTV